MVQYTSSSPYYTTSQTSWYLDFLNYRELPIDSSDYYLTVSGKYEERPDLLSYDLYGTVNYWWIFSVMNQDILIDPIYDLKTNLIIRIPTSSRLSSLLG